MRDMACRARHLAAGACFAALAALAGVPVLSAITAAPAIAAERAQEAPAWAPETFTLSNGMQVVVLPDHRAPVVTHMLWYKVGAADEAPGKSGIAHLFEHLMFKATDKIPAGEFSKIVARNGGQDNAFTSWDYTAYFQRVAKDRLPLMMQMEADRMTRLQLTDEEVLPERDVVKEERRQRTDNNPGSILFEKAMAALYRDHPYAIPVIGFMDEVAELTRQDALDFYARWYGPENAVLVVAGDITAAELQPMAEAIYGPISPKGDLQTRNWPDVIPLPASVEVSHADPKVRQPELSLYFIGTSYMSGEGLEPHALDVAIDVLGGGQTSRLYRGLVETGLAVSASANVWTSLTAPAPIIISVTPAEGVSLDDLLVATDAIVADFLAEGPTQEEADRAIRSLVASTIYSRDSQSSMARIYGATLAQGGTVDDVLAWPGEVEQVTPDMARDAARKYIVRDRTVIARLWPEGEGE